MNYLIENIPLISGVAVGLLSFLSSFIKFLNERNIRTKGIKRIKDYTDIYVALPDSMNAKNNVAKLLDRETEQVLKRTSRKANVANIVAVVVVAVVGGVASYLLALWATNSNIIILTVLAWLLLATSVLFTLALSIVGLASIYDEPKAKK